MLQTNILLIKKRLADFKSNLPSFHIKMINKTLNDLEREYKINLLKIDLKFKNKEIRILNNCIKNLNKIIESIKINLK